MGRWVGQAASAPLAPHCSPNSEAPADFIPDSNSGFPRPGSAVGSYGLLQLWKAPEQVSESRLHAERPFLLPENPTRVSQRSGHNARTCGPPRGRAPSVLRGLGAPRPLGVHPEGGGHSKTAKEGISSAAFAFSFICSCRFFLIQDSTSET